ncbi:MAG: hypothetical protein J2P18_04405 [Nocardia sp.]|nr:hypothetical protein [Nocardia sp.]
MASRPPVNRVSSRMRAGERGAADARPVSNRTTSAASTATKSASAKSAGTVAGRSATSKPAAGRPGIRRSRTAMVRAGSAPSRPKAARPRPSMPRPRPNLPRLRLPGSWGMAGWLIAVSVLLTAFAVIAALRPGVGDGNKAFADNTATQEVTAAADNALKVVYSYDVKSIGGYKDAVHKVVTGKMRTDFDKFADTTVSSIQQAQSSAQAKPDPIGVTLLTDDRAELLVNLTVSATKDGVPQQSASGPIVLRMEKVDGSWKASEISDR